VRRLVALALGLVMIAGLSGPASASHDAASSYDVVEQALYDLTVNHRGPIASHPNLDHLSRRRAREIYDEYRATGKISHKGAFVGIGSYFCRYSEIIAYSFISDWPTSVAWVVNAWHNSPTHEAVLHGTWSNDKIGVGRYGNSTTGRFYVEVYADYCP
jgi:hypothetical protein